ncbi:MAG: hypothetical protein ACI9R3_005079 [Verrucomicrobiales bacterium]|jgi:hypothetical protein
MDFLPSPHDIRRVGDLLLEEHGTVFFCSVGTVLFLFGYLGMHWIQRRRFYRRKLTNPFPSYFRYRLVKNAEGWLAVLFISSGCIGFLCFLGGVIDWIDG